MIKKKEFYLYGAKGDYQGMIRTYTREEALEQALEKLGIDLTLEPRV
jgi:hypothetical protein